ncbi:MAG TPA: outer membrane lipoprotein carrier protein LolA [Vicinamibacterales bacterium]|nr:outer membrane lipoprotein carrier protein LolA [Vicinamibacterales bacterium]
MRLLPFTAVGAVVLGVVLAAQSPAPAPAPEVARAVQQRYDTIRDFSAAFVHVYEGGVLRKKVTERGTVQIKKPGRMRWEYTAPEKKVFVADGTQIYSYIPEDRQVIVRPMPTTDEATTATLFLTGKGNLTRDFAVSFGELPGAPAGTLVLKLVPKQTERDYDTLFLAVERDTYQIRVLSAADRQGGRSTFTFTGIKENTGIADKTFTFRIPRGADVVR